MQRFLAWKCPRSDRKQHWSFRALPQFLSMVQGPAIARKRWEGLNPLEWEDMLRTWIQHSFLPVDEKTLDEKMSRACEQGLSDLSIPIPHEQATVWVRAMARTWHLKTLAEWDMQLIAATLPMVADSVMTPLWEPVRLKKRMQLFQLPDEWLTIYAEPATWPFAYWCARLAPWTTLLATLWPIIKTCWPQNSLQKGLEKGLEGRLYQQQILVLVEGQTEQRLLPLLAQRYGLQPNDWWCWPVGGKNQMLGAYECAQHAMAVPIVILLDADAAPVYAQLKHVLRPSDHICLLAHGELEDHLPVALLVNALNAAYPLHPLLTAQNFTANNFTANNVASTGLPLPACGRVEQLRQLWRDRQMGVFDKTTLALVISDYLQQANNVDV
jgi:hypothetical protein